MLGHPAPVSDVHTREHCIVAIAVDSHLDHMNASITKHSGIGIQPPRTIERWVRASVVSVILEARWKVQGIEESAPQYKG